MLPFSRTVEHFGYLQELHIEPSAFEVGGAAENADWIFGTSPPDHQPRLFIWSNGIFYLFVQRIKDIRLYFEIRFFL